MSSGFNVVISASEEPDEQVKSALVFLKRHRHDLLRLMRARGVSVTIDLACAQKEFRVRMAHLPSALLSAAGAFGIDIDVSFYLVA